MKIINLCLILCCASVFAQAQTSNIKGKLNDAWGDLADTDSWQNKYFDNKNDASRDSFFFFTPP